MSFSRAKRTSVFAGWTLTSTRSAGISRSKILQETSLHHSALERHFHARHHGAVADIAAIDIEILHTAAGAAAAGLGDESPDPVDALTVIHLHEVTAELPAQHGVSRAAELAVTGVTYCSLPSRMNLKLTSGWLRATWPTMSATKVPSLESF